jgi:hypothetical protein
MKKYRILDLTIKELQKTIQNTDPKLLMERVLIELQEEEKTNKEKSPLTQKLSEELATKIKEIQKLDFILGL